MVKESGRPRHDTANEIDLHIGQYLCTARNLAGLSQEALGKKIGVTYQQIQKYERGKNRISASTLYEICKVLSVHITYFFGTIDPEDEQQGDTLPPETPVIKARYQLIKECEKLKDVIFIKSLTIFLRALS